MREIKFKRHFFYDEEKTKYSHADIWGVKIGVSEFTSPSQNNFAPYYIDCQFTGLKDKNGKEIYEGDEVQYHEPYRTTQTHEGDNIPNGSYTEPMEPGIRTICGIVKFIDGSFIFENYDKPDDFITPISWCLREWDLESIKEAISWTRQTDVWFDDPDEGDLQYLIKECAKVENSDQLISYLSGIEIVGNEFDSPELLKSQHEKQPN